MKLNSLLQKFGIKQSLFALFSILTVLHFIVGTASFAPLVQVGSDFTSLRANNLQSVACLTQVERRFLKLKNTETTLSRLSVVALNETLADDQKLIRQINSGITSYQPFADTPIERAALENWQTAFPEYLDKRAFFLQLIKSKKISEAKIYEAQKIYPLFDIIEKSLDRLINYQSEEAVVKEQHVDSYINKSKLIITLLTLVNGLLGGLITWVAVNWISKSQQQKLETLGKMSDLWEIAGNVAHEINNPLTIVKLAMDEIRETVPQAETGSITYEKLFNKIDSSIARIAKVCSGLKSFSRDGSSDPFTTFHVKEMFEETLSFCMNKIKKRSILCQMSPIPESLTLEGRPTELSRVIVNLIGNAIDAIEKLDEKWITLTLSDFENYVEISVVDSGRGIPKNLREKMFKMPFSTKPIENGKGVGLGICRKIIESHNGIIFVDDKCPNTRFVIHLPKSHGYCLTQAS